MPCHIPIIVESFLNHSWYIWANYNDLTTTSLEIIVSKGNHPQMAQQFRLVNYYNLPRYIVILLLNMLQLPRIHPQPQPPPACPQPGLRHCWLPARRVPRPNSSWWMGPCNTCGLADWSYNGYIKWYYDILYVGYLGYLYIYIHIIIIYIHIYIYMHTSL